jgi:predicted DNA-binding protein (MmcQ/YjbR family)
MHIDDFRNYCLDKKGVTEEFPFDDHVLVFKVMGKMFALADVDHFESINLKCDPLKAIELREQYSGVIPGFHMNKKHWNTVMMDDSISNILVRGWIEDSYQLVVKGLPGKIQVQLKGEV